MHRLILTIRKRPTTCITDIWIKTSTTIRDKVMASSASNRKNARTNNKEKIDILIVGLSTRRNKKETVDGDRQTSGVERRRRPAVTTALPKNLIRPLPRAGMRGDVGFRAYSPDTDGTSAMGWGRRWQRNNVARNWWISRYWGRRLVPYLYTHRTQLRKALSRSINHSVMVITCRLSTYQIGWHNFLHAYKNLEW